MKFKKLVSIIMSGLFIFSLVGCNSNQESISGSASSEQVVESTTGETVHATKEAKTSENDAPNINSSLNESSLLDTSDMFSDRDLEQEADLTDAVYIDLESDKKITLNEKGVYVLKGDVSNSMIVVDADDEENVQLVLDGVSITNDNAPAIYVKAADKVFITTTNSNNSLEVTGSFNSDGDVNLDAVIYSKSDLVLNGVGTLDITSSQGNGITSKDDLKVTGGTYVITTEKDSMEANDSIRIYDGDFTIVANKDGLHSENTDDKSLGYIYIQNGNFEIKAADDAIQGNSVVQIDGGTINVSKCVEGIEATYIVINQGTINIYATDDGINATSLSDYDVTIEVNGGDITVEMASGDTDGFDSNGNIYINGGNIDVTAVSSFDADGQAVLNGGVVVVNGVTVSELPASQMGKGKGNRQ
jgi:hypothetical protein